MRDRFLAIRIKAQNLIADNEGQDLVEYALLIALIALVAVAGEGKLATALKGAFSTIGTTVTGDV